MLDLSIYGDGVVVEEDWEQDGKKNSKGSIENNNGDSIVD